MSSSYPNFSYKVTFDTEPNGKARGARLGVIETPHGSLETPNYIFCGTRGGLRCLTPKDARDAGADIILSNTYHMLIQPGPETVRDLGGLHQMYGWDGPMMTDSGGFQIFAMGEGTVADEIKGRRKQNPKERSVLELSEEGARFKSYLDGSEILLTPEYCMDIQRMLGADLIYVLDECSPHHVGKDYTAKSMEMSHRWEKRSLDQFMRHNDGKQALYGIIQGGVYEDLRRASTDWVAQQDFFGTAIGGSLGVSVDQAYDEVIRWCMEGVPSDRPVHLLGIGSIRDVFQGVRYGIDTFDCVTPTRIARHGWALVKGAPNERLNLRNAKYKGDTTPLDETQDNYYSQTFSRGYLHHLIKAREPLAMHILSVHNIATMTRLMREVRAAIRDNTLDSLESAWLPR